MDRQTCGLQQALRQVLGEGRGTALAVFRRGLVLLKKAAQAAESPLACPVLPIAHSLLAIQKTAETTPPPTQKPEGPHHVLPADISCPENILLPLTSAGLGGPLTPLGAGSLARLGWGTES